MPDVFVSQPEKLPQNPTVTPTVPDSEQKRMIYGEHNHNRLSSFRLYPESVGFETKEKEEKVILLLRQHPIVNVKWILVTVLMSFVPGLAGMFGILASFPAGFDLVITLAWYLVTFAYALENFLSWFFNVYFVTNIRVVDVDFYNLVYKQVSDANLDKIQDVTYNMGGVIRTIFNFGNVFVQTAAEVSEFDFMAVPNPDKVAKIIEDLITQH